MIKMKKRRDKIILKNSNFNKIKLITKNKNNKLKSTNGINYMNNKRACHKLINKNLFLIIYKITMMNTCKSMKIEIT